MEQEVHPRHLQESNGGNKRRFKMKYIEDIQMFLLNMSFISRVKWTIFIFHEWRSHE